MATTRTCLPGSMLSLSRSAPVGLRNQSRPCHICQRTTASPAKTMLLCSGTTIVRPSNCQDHWHDRCPSQQKKRHMCEVEFDQKFKMLIGMLFGPIKSCNARELSVVRGMAYLGVQREGSWGRSRATRLDSPARRTVRTVYI
jgi:hypothetical protein